MKWMTALIAALLTGCATSPQEVVEQGSRHTGSIGKPLAEAVACVSKSAGQAHLISVTGTTETELVIRATIDPSFTLSVWRFKAAGNATAYQAWVSASYQPDHAAYLSRIRGAC